MNQYNENGVKHGPWEGYHGNGKLAFKGTYINGNEYGLFGYYYINGNLNGVPYLFKLKVSLKFK